MTAGLKNPSTSRVYRGVAAGAVLGALDVAAVFLAPTSVVFPLVAFLLLPLIVGYSISYGDLLDRALFAITLTLTLELLFGGAGNWATVFGGPIRYGLLLSGLLAGGLHLLRRRDPDVLRSETLVVAFFGFLLPVFWVFYAVARGVSPGAAVGGAGFLLTLLVYLPFFGVFRRQASLFVGALLGGFFVLCAALLPAPLAADAYLGWFSGNVSEFPNGFPRVSLAAKIFLPVGMVWGLLYFADPAGPRFQKTAGLALLTVSTVALALTYSRGLLAAVALVLIITLVAGSFIPRTRTLRWRSLGAAALMAPLLLAIMVSLSPQGFGRFLNVPQELVSLASSGAQESGTPQQASPQGPPEADTPQAGAPQGGQAGSSPAAGGGEPERPVSNASRIRSEQAGELLDEWREYPLFGKGLGSVPEGYTRGADDPALFELEYHTLLYKVGAGGLGVFLLLPLFLAARYVVLLRRRSGLLYTPEGKFAAAVLATTLVVVIAGAANPLLTSAYFGFLVALYLAAEVRLRPTQKTGEDPPEPPAPESRNVA